MAEYIQGKYTLKNPSKYVGDKTNIVFRSSWEYKFMTWCDANPSVLHWGSEIHPIEYFSKIDNKVRRYFVDFFVKILRNDGNTEVMMVEIKPHAEKFPPKKGSKKEKRYIQEVATYQRNQDKWDAATKFAQKHNMKFVIFDEYDLGIKKWREK